MIDISEAERLALITSLQVDLVFDEVRALEEERAARCAKLDEADEGRAFSQDRARQRQPQNPPHACTVIPFPIKRRPI
jgi:hypothetical protein